MAARAPSPWSITCGPQIALAPGDATATSIRMESDYKNEGLGFLVPALGWSTTEYSTARLPSAISTSDMRTHYHCIFGAAATVLAQAVTIPAVDGSLPAAGSNGCAPGYYPGTDTVLFTVPYTYQQVLTVIGNYTNLTWSGSPDNSVTTNNTDALTTNNWTPGSARTYDISGAHVIETITVYDKPANGPYVEVHTVAPLSVPSYNVSFYSDFDGQVWTETCGGKATASNFTANFCATNSTVASAVLHALHFTDAATVGSFLGGQNYTSCAALGNASGTASSTVPYTGAATSQRTRFRLHVIGIGAVTLVLTFWLV